MNLFHRKCQERETIHISRFEPTDTDLLAQAIAKDLFAMASIIGLVTAIVVWSFV